MSIANDAPYLNITPVGDTASNVFWNITDPESAALQEVISLVPPGDTADAGDAFPPVIAV